jgi:hypothetical protein
MGHVFGDSTPFPHDADFIEIIRHAVEQGVKLLGAEEAIAQALRRSDSVEQQRQTLRSQLAMLGDAIALSLDNFGSVKSERVASVCGGIREAAKSLIGAQMQSLDNLATEKLSSSRAAIDSAREDAFHCIESFVLRHDLPETAVGLHLTAGENRYVGEALVGTPFGVEAVFALAIPAAHDWGHPRRVVELNAGTDVHVPMESGVFSKRIEPRLVKLDRLFVSEVSLARGRARIRLRKGPRSGGGFDLDLPAEGTTPALLRLLSEEGVVAPDEPLSLGDDDGVHVTRLRNRVIETTRDLAARREAMTGATFDGKPFKELEHPREVCERLVTVMAPIVQEIGRRSGAPGELVLRRDVGQGRRDEVYITKAELHEQVLALPDELQHVFDPFKLGEGPRSPRAPSYSERIVLDPRLATTTPATKPE